VDFQFTEEQIMLKKALTTMLKKELSFDLLRDIAENKGGFSNELWKKVAEGGWLGLLAKGEQKTLDDMSVLDLVYLSETFGEYLFPGPFSLTAGFIVPFLSQLELNEEHQHLVQGLIEGETIVTMALPRLQKDRFDVGFNWSTIKISSQTEEKMFPLYNKQITFFYQLKIVSVEYQLLQYRLHKMGFELRLKQ
jgi:acyl-CoA dehydrogenase